MHCSSPLDVAKQIVPLQGPQNLAQDFTTFNFTLEPPTCRFKKKWVFFPHYLDYLISGTAKMPSHDTV